MKIKTPLPQSPLALSAVLFLTTALWGIFWLPLRHIESAGISGTWAVFAINIVPLLFLLPLVIVRRHLLLDNFSTKCLVGIGMGGGMALYAIALLHTTILQTTLLFYMSPIWATLLSRLLLKEKIGIGRWVAIAVGFSGILLILSGSDATENGSTLNLGSVFALLSGLFWGYGTVAVRGSANIPSVDMVPSQYFWATAISGLVLLTTVNTPSFTIPQSSAWLNALPLIIGFYVLLTLPTIFICTRIAQLLSPGRVCLLMMSEVLVAGISAPLLAGEKISIVEWVAGLLIVTATLIEVLSTPNNPISSNNDNSTG